MLPNIKNKLSNPFRPSDSPNTAGNNTTNNERSGSSYFNIELNTLSTTTSSQSLSEDGIDNSMVTPLGTSNEFCSEAHPKMQLTSYLVVQELEHYSYSANTTSVKDKKAISKAIEDLRLTKQDAKNILAFLSNSDRPVHNLTITQQLVAHVLVHLKYDHRHVLHSGSYPKSYKNVISYLEKLSDASETTASPVISNIPLQKLSSQDFSPQDFYTAILRSHTKRLLVPDIWIFEHVKELGFEMPTLPITKDDAYYVEALKCFHANDFYKGMQIIDDAAGKNNTAAQNNLGQCYEKGIGIEKNDKMAFDSYKKAADLGNITAMFNLGRCYEKAIGVRKNDKLAFQWNQKAAKLGHTVAMFNLGACYLNGTGVKKNDKIAFEWLQKAARAGDPLVMNALGHYFQEGSRKYMAVICYEVAAIEGNISAINHLGFCYVKGIGVKQDHNMAFQWYKKAAILGYPAAMFNLGLCHTNGTGVEKNDEIGFDWYEKAAKLGYPPAMKNLGDYYEKGTGVEKNDEIAFQWYKKSADLGYQPAMSNLGVCYEKGTGIEKNDKIAFDWYEKAAKLGYPPAMFNLGRCYEKGTGIEKNGNKAFEWYEKAADLEYPPAMVNLADCYEKGTGGKQDAKMAFAFYQKAADLGNPSAMNKLGDCYKDGIGVEKDPIKAKEWDDRYNNNRGKN